MQRPPGAWPWVTGALTLSRTGTQAPREETQDSGCLLSGFPDPAFVSRPPPSCCQGPEFSLRLCQPALAPELWVLLAPCGQRALLTAGTQAGPGSELRCSQACPGGLACPGPGGPTRPAPCLSLLLVCGLGQGLLGLRS